LTHAHNILARGGIIEASHDGQGGPRWVATLEDGTMVVGKPSWMGNSGPVALPNDMPVPMSDWQRLRDRCLETRTRLKALSIFVPPWGAFHAPVNCGAYGFFENHVISRRSRAAGCKGLTIVWEKDGAVKGYKVLASGVLEGVKYPGRLPSMIAVD